MSELDRLKEQLVYLRFWLGDNGRDRDHVGRLAHFNAEHRRPGFVVPRGRRRGRA